MERAGDFIFIKKSDKNEDGEVVSLNKLKLKRPILLIFNGNGIESNRQAKLSIDVIDSLLGVFKNDVDVLSVNYNSGTYNDDLYETNISNIVDNLFVRLISKNGKRLDIKEACKNMRNITIFAHCFGDKIIRDIVISLDFEMQCMNYDKKERMVILKQIFAVIYAIKTTNQEINYLNVISPNDMVFNGEGDKQWEDFALKLKDENFKSEIKISDEDVKNIENIINDAKEKNPLRNFGSGKVLEPFYKYNDRCYIINDGNGLRIITSPMFVSDKFEHTMRRLSRGENWQPCEDTKPSGDYVSKCISSALCNSVANSILNNNSERFKEFNIEDLKLQLEEVVQALNEQKVNFIL